MIRPKHFAALLALLAVGCASSVDDQIEADRENIRQRTGGVKLTDLQTADDTLPPELLAADPDAVPVRVGIIDLPIKASIDEAWSLIGYGGLDDAETDRLQANGWRVATLDRFDITKFSDALPKTIGFRKSVRVLADEPRPLILSPTFHEPITTYIQLPGQPARRLTLDGGYLQFNVTARKVDDGLIALSLTPHYYQPKQTLRVRSPQEQALDGESFTELTLHATLAPHQLLLVGLHRPPPIETSRGSTEESDEPETPTEDDAAHDDGDVDVNPSTSDDAEQPTTQPKPQSHYILAPLPDRIGTVMLTAKRHHQSLQRLMIISIEMPLPAHDQEPPDDVTPQP